MSTPSAEAKNGNRRRMALSKYLKKMRSVFVFKRDKTTTTTTTKTPCVVTPAAPSVAPTPPSKQEAAKDEEAAPIAPLTTTIIEPAAIIQDIPSTTPTVVTREFHRSTMQQERARALFAKYGLTLESHEWIAASTPVPTVQRVEKSIRMRVHRACHHCGTLYKSDKVCSNCDHKRCKKCPRYPRKKTATDMPKEKPLVDRPNNKKKVLTITTKAGHEPAYQPPKQRIRRTCHRCDCVFVPPTATICEQCRHIRCTKCPREPAKRQKWPAAYPSDVDADSDSEMEKQLERFRRTWRKPRQRVRWECEQCHGIFLNGSLQCPGCGHGRCDRCTRSPMKKPKVEEQFDPQLVAAVEAKLRALGVDDDPPTSEPEEV